MKRGILVLTQLKEAAIFLRLDIETRFSVFKHNSFRNINLATKDLVVFREKILEQPWETLLLEDELSFKHLLLGLLLLGQIELFTKDVDLCRLESNFLQPPVVQKLVLYELLKALLVLGSLIDFEAILVCLLPCWANTLSTRTVMAVLECLIRLFLVSWKLMRVLCLRIIVHAL